MCKILPPCLQNKTDTLKNKQLKNKLEVLIRNSTQYTSHLDEVLLHCMSYSTGTVSVKVQGLQATAVVNDFVDMVASGDIGRITLPGTNITLSVLPVVVTLDDMPSVAGAADEDENGSVVHGQVWLPVSLVIIIILLLIGSGIM